MNLFLKLFVRTHVGLFRLTNGRFGSSMMGGKVLLLTTTGNKSGKPRTVPVMQFDDDDGKRYIVGSFGGAPKDPAWIRNLTKTPDVGIEVRGEKYRARATVLSGADRDRIFAKVKAKAPNFAEYEKRAGDARQIPVVEIVRGS
jgi:deazaflavin-dependent oxidoreductase (nitroreductase family)